MSLKTIAEWTIEDCDSKEYWKTLFEWGSTIKLKALGNDFCPNWENSELLRWTGGNKIVANKMLLDLMENKYLIGGVVEGQVLYAKALWEIKKD